LNTSFSSVLMWRELLNFFWACMAMKLSNSPNWIEPPASQKD
jgi:hypothetical protein